MKLKDLRDAADGFSGKASDLVRQLSFAGIAVIWIFRSGDNAGGITYTTELLYPLGCFVLSLAFDFLQYLYGSLAWLTLHTVKQYKEVKEKDVFKAPGWINYPTNFIFGLKVISILMGYILLLMVIGSQL